MRVIKRFIALIIVLLLNASFFWNPFPKRLLGEYNGVQESYIIWVEGEEVEIPSSEINLELLNYEKVVMKSNNQFQKYDYEVENKTKNYYNLSIKIDNHKSERWQLYRRPKKIIRPQQAPRPETIYLKD